MIAAGDYYLEQHTSGRAREIVQSCMYLNPEEKIRTDPSEVLIIRVY